MKENIKAQCKELSLLTERISESLEQVELTFEVSQLHEKDFVRNDIRDEEFCKTFFDRVQLLDNHPAVYVFTIVKGKDNGVIRKEFQDWAEAHPEYQSPACYKKFDVSSQTLYVGKVERCITGRLMNHLGIHCNHPNAHGLHLVKWANDFTLRIQVCFFKVENDRKIAGLIENRLSLELKPILGKRTL